MSKEINTIFLILGLICLAFVAVSSYMILRFKQQSISVLNFEKAVPYIAKQYYKNNLNTKH